MTKQGSHIFKGLQGSVLERRKLSFWFSPGFVIPRWGFTDQRIWRALGGNKALAMCPGLNRDQQVTTLKRYSQLSHCTSLPAIWTDSGLLIDQVSAYCRDLSFTCKLTTTLPSAWTDPRLFVNHVSACCLDQSFACLLTTSLPVASTVLSAHPTDYVTARHQSYPSSVNKCRTGTTGKLWFTLFFSLLYFLASKHSIVLWGTATLQ